MEMNIIMLLQCSQFSNVLKQCVGKNDHICKICTQQPTRNVLSCLPVDL